MQKASELLTEALRLLDEAPAPIAANRVQHALDTVTEEIGPAVPGHSIH